MLTMQAVAAARRTHHRCDALLIARCGKMSVRGAHFYIICFWSFIYLGREGEGIHANQTGHQTYGRREKCLDFRGAVERKAHLGVLVGQIGPVTGENPLVQAGRVVSIEEISGVARDGDCRDGQAEERGREDEGADMDNLAPGHFDDGPHADLNCASDWADPVGRDIAV